MFEAEAEAVEAVAKSLRPRPRPEFWPRGQFGLEDLTSLVFRIARLHSFRNAKRDIGRPIAFRQSVFLSLSVRPSIRLPISRTLLLCQLSNRSSYKLCCLNIAFRNLGRGQQALTKRTLIRVGYKNSAILGQYLRMSEMVKDNHNIKR